MEEKGKMTLNISTSNVLFERECNAQPYKNKELELLLLLFSVVADKTSNLLSDVVGMCALNMNTFLMT